MNKYLLGTILILLPMATAIADDGSLGLSQIDFDGQRGPSLSFSTASAPDSKSRVITNVKQASIASNPAPSEVASTEQIAVKPAALVDTSDSSSVRKKQKLEYLTPLLRGMKTDKDRHDSWITSNHSWRKARKKSCGDPVDEANLRAKSDAIREVLRRFSGDDAFADSQCGKECKKDGYVSKLTGVAVKSANGGTFKFIEKKGQCRYRLTKKSQEAWKILRPARVKCACLPD